MSLVGTRPPTVDEWEQYELHHRSRMSTKPECRKQQYTDRADLQQHRRTDRRKTRLRRRRRWLPSGHSEKRRNPTAGRRTPERGVHGQPGWSSGLQACVGMRF